MVPFASSSAALSSALLGGAWGAVGACVSDCLVESVVGGLRMGLTASEHVCDLGGKLWGQFLGKDVVHFKRKPWTSKVAVEVRNNFCA